MRDITAGAVLILILSHAACSQQLTGYFFRDETKSSEHILFLSDLKNLDSFKKLKDSDLIYEPPQDFFLIIHETDYMVMAKTFKQEPKEQEKEEEKPKIKEQQYQMTLNDILYFVQPPQRHKTEYKVRVLEQDFTRDPNGMIYFEGYEYRVQLSQEEVKATSLLVPKINSAPRLIENQIITAPDKTELVTSFKTNTLHVIYIASGSLCSDSSFTKSKSRHDSIGANRRLCRELIHWLMEEDPLVQQTKFEEHDAQIVIHKTRNIFSFPKVPYYLEIWLLILVFVWFILRLVYSGHKGWVRADKLKDKPPEDELPSYQDEKNKKQRRKIDVKPIFSSVNDARRRKDPLNGQEGEQ